MATTDSQRLPVVVVLGPPGIGKGTLCMQLAFRLRMYHLSAGDFCRKLLRREIISGIEVCPEMVRGPLEKGDAVPGAHIVPLLQMHFRSVEQENRYRGVLLDAFPRTADQLDHFREAFPEPVIVVSLSCDKNVILRRYLSRQDPDRPGEDEACFNLRLQKFIDESGDITQYYNARNLLRIVEAWESTQEVADKIIGPIAEKLN